MWIGDLRAHLFLLWVFSVKTGVYAGQTTYIYAQVPLHDPRPFVSNNANLLLSTLQYSIDLINNSTLLPETTLALTSNSADAPSEVDIAYDAIQEDVIQLGGVLVSVVCVGVSWCESRCV